MLIKICLNGARPKAENDYIPQSVEEIIKEVKLLYDKGFNFFHIHCYDDYGSESLKPPDVKKLISSVKNIASGISLGISSGDWIEPDLKKRIEYIKSWEFTPDFISLNYIEEDALHIAEVLINKGIPIEAGLNEKAAAEIFVKSGTAEMCCRILIEPEAENIEKALMAVNEIEKVLDENKVQLKRLLHGYNNTSWPLLREAKRRRYDTRIGMEDTIFSPGGSAVKSNLELALAAQKL